MYIHVCTMFRHVCTVFKLQILVQVVRIPEAARRRPLARAAVKQQRHGYRDNGRENLKVCVLRVSAYILPSCANRVTVSGRGPAGLGKQ